jgi:hypothetical protein
LVSVAVALVPPRPRISRFRTGLQLVASNCGLHYTPVCRSVVVNSAMSGKAVASDANSHASLPGLPTRVADETAHPWRRKSHDQSLLLSWTRASSGKYDRVIPVAGGLDPFFRPPHLLSAIVLPTPANAIGPEKLTIEAAWVIGRALEVLSPARTGLPEPARKQQPFGS